MTAARHVAAAVVFAIAALSTAVAGADGYVFDTIALSGRPAAARGGDWRFTDFFLPRINASGQVLFPANIADADGVAADTKGAWIVLDDAPELLALKGDVIDSDTGIKVTEFREWFIGPTGDSLLHVVTDAPQIGLPIHTPDYRYALLAGRPGSVHTISGRALPAPDGLGGKDLGVEYRFGLNGEGRYLFANVILEDDGRETPNVWLGQIGVGNDTPSRIWSYEPVDGCCGFASLGVLTADRALLYGVLPSASGPEPLRGLWRMTFASGVEPIVIQDEPAPGLDGLSQDWVLDVIASNAAGDVVFPTIVKGDGIDATNNQALWYRAHDSNMLVLLIHEGDPVPGSPGVSFFDIPAITNGTQHAVVDASGTAIFCTNHGIWAGTPGAIGKIVGEGDAAPGTDAVFNGTFADLPGNEFDCGVYANRSGEIAFLGRLESSDAMEPTGIWAGPPDALRLVVKSGHTIRVGSGDTRTVSEVAMFNPYYFPSGGEDGRATVLNDAGQIVFKAKFTDASEGVFRATPFAPPVAAKLVPVLDFLLDE